MYKFNKYDFLVLSVFLWLIGDLVSTFVALTLGFKEGNFLSLNIYHIIILKYAVLVSIILVDNFILSGKFLNLISLFMFLIGCYVIYNNVYIIIYKTPPEGLFFSITSWLKAF